MHRFFLLGIFLLLAAWHANAAEPCRANAAAPPRAIMGLHLLRPEEQRSWEQAAELGVDWVRVELHWYLVEPTEGAFSWHLIDQALHHSSTGTARIMLLVNNMPEWAVRHAQPQEAFRRLLAAFFARYRGRLGQVGGYEIFNEPNNPGFGWLSMNRQPEQNTHIGDEASAALFAAFLRTANSEIRKHQPDAFIISGGLFSRENDVPYLRHALGQGVADCFDIIGYHPYANLQAATEIQDRLARAFGKPVWFTEYGTTDNDARTGIMTGMFAQKQQLNALFWFIDRDFGLFSDTYGLVDYLGHPKPDYALFKRLQAGGRK